MKAVSENIRRYREAAHLSPQDLASRITVTEKNVEGWECGALQPDLETLKLIAAALDVDIMDLVYGQCRPDAFLHEKPRRIKNHVTVGSNFRRVPGVLLFFISRGDSAKTTESPVSRISGAGSLCIRRRGICIFWAIWYDFRVSSQSLRECLISLGVFFIIAYYIDLLLQYMPKYHYLALFSLYKHPLIFILPGTLFFLGCNIKPE